MERPSEKVMNKMSINKWGVMFEVMTAIEEIGELLIELNKEDDDIDSLLGELADVSIMMGQLSEAFAIEADDSIIATNNLEFYLGNLLSNINKFNRARIDKFELGTSIMQVKESIANYVVSGELALFEKYIEIRKKKLDKLWHHLQNTPIADGISKIDSK